LVFHLITHAFFKALLFMGAGSVIHARTTSRTFAAWAASKSDMPLTFLTYAIGMLALCGFPLLFSGFWRKTASRSGNQWSVAENPVYCRLRRSTYAFYMTAPRSANVFFRYNRGTSRHTRPRVMTMPLAIWASSPFRPRLPSGTAAWRGSMAFLKATPPPFSSMDSRTRPALGSCHALPRCPSRPMPWRLAHRARHARREAPDARKNPSPGSDHSQKQSSTSDESTRATFIAFLTPGGRASPTGSIAASLGAPLRSLPGSWALVRAQTSFSMPALVTAPSDKGCENLHKRAACWPGCRAPWQPT